MPQFTWSADLSVGVDLIDKQHQQWFAYLNDFANAVEKRQGTAQIAKTLAFLTDYTERHFETEADRMSASAYPDAPAHLAKHEEMKNTLAHLASDFEEEGVTPELVEAVNVFLVNWLTRHILDVDSKLGAWLVAHPVAE